MSESSLRVIVLPSLVYPEKWLNIEQDEVRKPWLIKRQETMKWKYFGEILKGDVY